MPGHPSHLKLLKEYQRPQIVFSLARAPQSSRLYTACWDRKIYELDLTQEKPELGVFEGHASYVSGIVLAGEQLVSCGWDRKLIWWDRGTRQPVRTLDAHQKWIRCLAVSPDGTRLASVADDMTLKLWQTASGSLERELRGHELLTPHHYPSMLFVCRFSPDGQWVATADKTGRLCVWNAVTGEQGSLIEATGLYTWDPTQRRHSIGGPRSLAFSPDASLLAVGGMGQVNNIDHLEGKIRLEVYDWRKKEKVLEWESDQYKGLIEHLEFGPDGTWLVGAGGDNGGCIFSFDLTTKQPIKQENAPTHVNELAFDENYEVLYAAANHRVVTWSLTPPPA